MPKTYLQLKFPFQLHINPSECFFIVLEFKEHCPIVLYLT